jgi:hypothetical protein
MFEENNATFSIPIICDGPQISNFNISDFSLSFQLLINENPVCACLMIIGFLTHLIAASCFGAANLSWIKACFLIMDFT